MKKLPAAVPVIALAAGSSLAACGSHTIIVKVAPTVTHTVTPAAAVVTSFSSITDR